MADSKSSVSGVAAGVTFRYQTAAGVTIFVCRPVQTAPGQALPQGLADATAHLIRDNWLDTRETWLEAALGSDAVQHMRAEAESEAPFQTQAREWAARSFAGDQSVVVLYALAEHDPARNVHCTVKVSDGQGQERLMDIWAYAALDRQLGNQSSAEPATRILDIGVDRGADASLAGRFMIDAGMAAFVPGGHAAVRSPETDTGRRERLSHLKFEPGDQQPYTMPDVFANGAGLTCIDVVGPESAVVRQMLAHTPGWPIAGAEAIEHPFTILG